MHDIHVFQIHCDSLAYEEPKLVHLGKHPANPGLCLDRLSPPLLASLLRGGKVLCNGFVWI